MQKKKKVLIGVVIAIVIVLIISLILIYSKPKTTGRVISEDEKDKVNECLTQLNAKLYLNAENLTLAKKEIILTGYLKNVKVINCAKNKAICENNKITTYPTWVLNGKKIQKDIRIAELLKECE